MGIPLKRKAGAWAAVAFFFLLAWGFSHHAPQQQSRIHWHQDHPGSPQNQADLSVSGTKPSAQINQSNAADRPYESSTDSIARWGLFISLLQLLVIAFQAIIYERQRILMYQQTKAMIGQRRIAAKQTRLMEKQAKLTEEITELTTQEYFATHRPRIRVRDIQFSLGGLMSLDSTSILFVVVNVGETEAMSVSVNAVLEFKQNDTWDRVLLFDQVPVVAEFLLIKSGGRESCLVTINNNMETISRFLDKGMNGNSVKFVLSGAVFYEGVAEFGKYCTRFTREYDWANSAWVPSKDPEENYDD